MGRSHCERSMPMKELSMATPGVTWGDRKRARTATVALAAVAAVLATTAGRPTLADASAAGTGVEVVTGPAQVIVEAASPDQLRAAEQAAARQGAAVTRELALVNGFAATVP